MTCDNNMTSKSFKFNNNLAFESCVNYDRSLTLILAQAIQFPFESCVNYDRSLTQKQAL